MIQLYTYLLLMLSNPDSAVSTPDSLNLSAFPELQSASMAYQMTDAATGEVVMEHNPTKALAPASVLKLFTTALALDVLGSEARMKTNLYTSGTVSKGVLEGDLIFDANFDPSLASDRFDNTIGVKVKQIMIYLTSKGIKEIEGKIKIVEKVNAAERIPRTWVWEDIGNYYGAGLGSTILNENQLELHFKSGKKGTLTSLERTVPELTWLKFDNHVRASRKRKDLAYAFGSPGSNEITITGTIPQNNRDFKVKAALPNPSQALAFRLHKGLVSMGLKVEEGYAVISDIPSNAELVKEFTSATTKKIVRETNLHSVNILAEALLMNAYLHSESELPKNQWMLAELSKHLDTKGMKLYDACGLSRFNAVTVTQMNQLLTWMNGHKDGINFTRSYAIAGFSGTLKRFLKLTDAIGKFKGKSGSMSGVRAYCGELEGKSGKKYNLSIMVNNYDMSSRELVLLLEKWFLGLHQNF